MNHEPTLSEYWHVLQKRKWVVLLTFFSFLGFTMVFTYKQTPVYQAVCAVRIDRTNSALDAISDLFTWSPGNVMPTEVETIQSPIVLKIAAERVGFVHKGANRDTYYRAAYNLRGHILAKQVNDTNMISIEASAVDPFQAMNIANSVAEAYRDVTVESQIRDVRKARKVIEVQLKKAYSRLKESEDKLRTYKLTNKTLAEESETSYTLGQLYSLQDELRRIQSQRTENTAKISELRVKLSNPSMAWEDSPSTSYNFYITGLLQNYNDVRTKLESLLQTRTDTNDEVVELTQQKNRLQQQLNKAFRKQFSEDLDVMMKEDIAMARQEDERRAVIGRMVNAGPGKDLDLSRLTREVKSSEETYNQILRDYKAAKVRETNLGTRVSIVSPAIAPSNPIKPNKKLNLMLGALLGLVIGVVMATIVETTDTSIGAVDDIEHLLEVPVLAAIPQFGSKPGILQRIIPAGILSERHMNTMVEGKAALPTIFDPCSASAEAYRTLAANIIFYSRIEGNRKVFVITSAGAQEGKSVTISNLALVMAQAGKKTALVSCNLRRPSLHRFFYLPLIPGVADIFGGTCSLEDSIHHLADAAASDPRLAPVLKLPGIENLDIITSGTVPGNPIEVLNSPMMKDIITTLRSEYDIVLIDSPPVLPVADSLVLGQKADGVLLVYQLGHLPERAIIRAKKQIQALGIHIVGVIINNIRPEYKNVAPVYFSKEYMRATKNANKE